jgi:hypothetical protein
MRSKFVLALAAVSLAPAAHAADTLPLGALDPEATAGVSKADAAGDGSIQGAFAVRANESAAAARALDSRQAGAAADADLLRDANAMSLILGFGMSRSLQLSLGLHGTYENVSAEQRDELFAVEDSTIEAGGRGSVRDTGFSGASMLLKVRLLEASGFRLAAAPFVESGAGESATYSVTRSVGPKGGLMGLASYGAPGVADVTVNLGWRYRDPEAVGSKTLRHEMFYKGLVEGFLSKTFSLFVAGEGRRLAVADDASRGTSDGALVYEPQYGGAAHGGFQARVGDAALSAFMGGKVGKADAVGYGERTFGVSLAYELGNFRGRRSAKTRFALDIERAEAAKAEKAALIPMAKRPKSFVEEVEAVFPAQGDYPEMRTKASEEALQDAGDSIDDSDFKGAEKAAVRHRLKDGELSEDERVRQELEAIKEADAKAEAERLGREEAEAEAARKLRAEQARQDEKLMQEWMDEAQHDAASMPGIEAEEMRWQGLED